MKTAALATLLWACAATVAAETVSGTVRRVRDGDSLQLHSPQAGTIELRIAGIDAPELRQPRGKDARRALAHACLGRLAQAEVQDRDRYGRVVARVRCAGVDVGRSQVREGHAWVYRRYNHDPALPALEDSARLAHRGLWSERHPQPPWEYRARRR